MKKNDFVLPILIILLIFFVPASIYGVYKHNASDLDRDNPKHLYKKDNKLYFYSDKDELLGIYECQKAEVCDRVTTSIDDVQNVYNSGDFEMLPIYNNNFVFIKDNDQIYYYMIDNAHALYNLLLVKDYGLGLSGNLLIVQDETQKYGLFDPSTSTYIINPSYDYMALTGEELDENNQLSIAKIIVRKDGYYYLIDEVENELSARLSSPIYTYDDRAIYTVNDLGNYSVISYDGNPLLLEEFRSLNFLENCNVLVTTDYMVRIYNKDYTALYYNERHQDSGMSFEEEDNTVIITGADESVLATVTLDEENIINLEEE